MPDSPTSLLGRDIVTELGIGVLVAPGQTQNCLPLVETDISLKAWATQGSYG